MTTRTIVLILLLPTGYLAYLGFVSFVAPWAFATTGDDREVSNTMYTEVWRQVAIVQAESSNSFEVSRMHVYPKFYDRTVVILEFDGRIQDHTIKLLESNLRAYFKSIAGDSRELDIRISRK